MTLVQKRLTQRKLHLNKACHTLGLDKIGNDTLHKPNPWEYLVDRKHHLVWCNVFKAASTSWMYNFNILAGWVLNISVKLTAETYNTSYRYSPRFLRKSRTPPLHLARQKYGRPTLESLHQALKEENVVSFLVVRHPLERLLSAYRDKIQHAVSGSHHFKLGKDIIRNYRTKVTLVSTKLVD